MKAVMFRDADYGALCVELGEGTSIVTVDNGFAANDGNLVRRVLERFAKNHTVVDESTTHWHVDLDCNSMSVVSAVESEMRMNGYDDDVLAERAITHVERGAGTCPDLPAPGKIIVHEAIERGIRQHLAVAVAALREHTKVTEPSLRYYRRPNAKMAGTVSAPFVVARIFAERSNADALRETVLAALEPIRNQLVKVSVHETDDQSAIEIGFAPTSELCEAFMDDAVPTFHYSDITGSRLVEFTLAEALTEQEREDIEELARVCTGATRISVEEGGRRVTARIPSNFIGNYVADRALTERLSWLNNVLEPWGCDVVGISDLAETLSEPEVKKVAPLQELGESALDEAVQVAVTLRDARAAAGSGPFRAPHYTASNRAMVQEVGLAAGGVLYLDQLEEFRKLGIEMVANEVRDRSDVTVMVSPPPTDERWLPRWKKFVRILFRGHAVYPESVDEAKFAKGEFSARTSQGNTTLKGKGFISDDGVWAIEKTKGGYYLSHIPSGAGLGGFKKRATADAVVDALDAIAGADWKSYTTPKRFPRSVMVAAGDIVAADQDRKIQPPEREVVKGERDVAGYVKLVVKNLKSGVKYSLTAPKTSYTSPDNFYASKPPTSGNGTENSDINPEAFGLERGDLEVMTALAKALKAPTKMKVRGKSR